MWLISKWQRVVLGLESGTYNEGNRQSQRSNTYSTSNPSSPAELTAYFRAADRLTGGGRKQTQVGTRKNGTPIYKPVYQDGRLNQFAQEGSTPVDYQPTASPGQYFSQDLSYDPVRADLTYQPTAGGDQTYHAVASDNLGYAPVNRDVTYRGVSDAEIQALGGLGATREYSARRARTQAMDEILADAGLTLAQRQRSGQLTDQDYADRLDAIGQETGAAITGAAMERAAQDQSGRLAQAQYDAGQAETALGASQFRAQFDTTQAQNDLAARQSEAAFLANENAKANASRVTQANFDAAERAKEYAGREATAAQQQALAGFLQTEQGRLYEAEVRNGNLLREDLLALAELYYGGKGQTTTTTTTSKMSASGGGI